MLRFFVLRFLLPLILFLILRAVLKSVWGTVNTVSRKDVNGSEAPQGGELRKDPVCGTYVAPGASVTKVVDGTPVYFCSTSCRDKFRAA